MKTIWIIYGETGEYDDWKEWPVCAYFDEEKAKTHAKLAAEFASEARHQGCMQTPRLYSYEITERWPNPYDVHMEIESNMDTHYYATPLEIRDELPKV